MKIEITIITDINGDYNDGIYFLDKISANESMSYKNFVVVYFDELKTNKFCIPDEVSISEQILNKYKRFQERMKMEEAID